jgi:hypothetical protein
VLRGNAVRWAITPHADERIGAADRGAVVGARLLNRGGRRGRKCQEREYPGDGETGH